MTADVLAWIAGGAIGFAIGFALLAWREMRERKYLRAQITEWEQGRRIAVSYDGQVLTAYIDGPPEVTLPPARRR